MNKLTFLSMATALVAALGTLSATAAVASDTVSATAVLPAQKIDSGLGDLPHYSLWADPTGKNPLRRAAGASGVRVQVAGEKQDSGLGELPHFSLWADMTERRAVQMSKAN